MTPVRLEPAALRSRVKHSTTEPLRSLKKKIDEIYKAKPHTFIHMNSLSGNPGSAFELDSNQNFFQGRYAVLSSGKAHLDVCGI